MEEIKVPLSALTKLPTMNKVVGHRKITNIFTNKEETVMLVIFRDKVEDGHCLRAGYFSISDGSYLGEHAFLKQAWQGL